MMIFLILKILGIVFLSVVALIFIALLYLLLAPFHIRARASFDSQEQSYRMLGRVSSVLYFLRFTYFLSEQERGRLAIHIFWGKIQIYPRVEEQESKNHPEANLLTEEVLTQEEPVSQGEERKEQQKETLQQEERSVRREQGSQQKSADLQEKDSRQGSGDPKGQRKKKDESSFGKRARALWNLRQDPHIRECIHWLVRRLLAFYRSLGMRLEKSWLSYSLGDPQHTAYVTGLATLFYPYTRGHLSLQADFQQEEVYGKGNVEFALHIRIGGVLWLFLRIFLSGKCRKTYHKIKEILDRT